MNSRERILILSIGSVAAFFVLWFVYGTIAGMYASRNKEKGTLESAVSLQRNLDRQILAAASRMQNYEERSLPPEPGLAKSAYQAWLLEQFSKSGMDQPQVQISRGKEERKLYAIHRFTLHSQGTLPQVAKLLHGFYSTDYMHRISRLHLKPVKASKKLDLIMDVDAMSLMKANVKELKERPANRLALTKQDDYVKIISERNIFGTANHAPLISALSEQKAVRGERTEIPIRASDPDKLDELSYTLVKTGSRDARLDSKTGRITWTPRATGKYEFTVRATDDGWPAKSSKDEVLVVMVENPPPPPPEPPKKLAFDDAKFTYLSGIIDKDGTGQIWLNIRPKGKTLKLAVGDKFEVGSVKGVVTAIGDEDFTFESDGKERKVSKGGKLEEAVSVEKDPAATEKDQ